MWDEYFTLPAGQAPRIAPEPGGRSPIRGSVHGRSTAERVTRCDGGVIGRAEISSRANLAGTSVAKKPGLCRSARTRSTYRCQGVPGSRHPIPVDLPCEENLDLHGISFPSCEVGVSLSGHDVREPHRLVDHRDAHAWDVSYLCDSSRSSLAVADIFCDIWIDPFCQEGCRPRVARHDRGIPPLRLHQGDRR
jgi:hypothetical protein